MKSVQLVREKVGSKVVESLFEGLSSVSRSTSLARQSIASLRVLRDLRYGTLDDQTLDIYLPSDGTPPRGIVFYVHGGGFRILSKDTHWLMGVGFAQQGFVVYNVNYRLAPRFPFPAALEDLALAWDWVMEHAARAGFSGGVVVAGESAGANLVTSLTIAATQERPEPFAKEIFQMGVVPTAVLANCGMLQVSDWERFPRRRPMHPWLQDRLREVTEAYLSGESSGTELADPLLVIENSEEWHRDLPPFFSCAGTRDPLLDDTRRLHSALGRLGVESRCEIYPGEVHAFHAFLWRQQARKCWVDQFTFLDDVLNREG